LQEVAIPFYVGQVSTKILYKGGEELCLFQVAIPFYVGQVSTYTIRITDEEVKELMSQSLFM